MLAGRMRASRCAPFEAAVPDAARDAGADERRPVVRVAAAHGDHHRAQHARQPLLRAGAGPEREYGALRLRLAAELYAAVGRIPAPKGKTALRERNAGEELTRALRT